MIIYGRRQIKAKWNNEEFGYFNTNTKIANAILYSLCLCSGYKIVINQNLIRFVFRFINRIQTSILVYNYNI